MLRREEVGVGGHDLGACRGLLLPHAHRAPLLHPFEAVAAKSLLECVRSTDTVGRLGARRCGVGQVAHRTPQLAEVEWLRHHGRDARWPRHVTHLDRARKDEDRRRRRALEAVEQGEAAGTRIAEANIEDDDVGAVCEIDGVVHRGRLQHLEAVELQVDAAEHAQGRVVVDEQDGAIAAAHERAPVAARSPRERGVAPEQLEALEQPR